MQAEAGDRVNGRRLVLVIEVEARTSIQSRVVKGGSSYLSQSELVLTFGMGSKTKADAVEVDWPSGQVDKLSNIATGQTITVQEGKGQIGARPYGKK